MSKGFKDDQPGKVEKIFLIYLRLNMKKAIEQKDQANARLSYT